MAYAGRSLQTLRHSSQCGNQNCTLIVRMLFAVVADRNVNPSHSTTIAGEISRKLFQKEISGLLHDGILSRDLTKQALLGFSLTYNINTWIIGSTIGIGYYCMLSVYLVS